MLKILIGMRLGLLLYPHKINTNDCGPFPTDLAIAPEIEESIRSKFRSRKLLKESGDDSRVIPNPGNKTIYKTTTPQASSIIEGRQ